MGIRTWLASRINGFLYGETKASPVGPMIVSAYGLSQPVRTPRRFDNLADAGYQQQPPIYRAINLISTACAGIPWVLYEKQGSNRRGKEIDQHPLIDLMQRPNTTQGWGKFFEAYISYIYIAGNSYVWANRAQNGKGVPLELWTLRPDRMRIKPDPKQFVGGYIYAVNGQEQEFDVRTILHTKTFAPLDDWYGLSPLAVAARAIDVRNSGGDWNLALLQNSGRLPGFFTSKERLGDTQFERMRQQLLDRYTGTRNIGLPGLLDGGDIGWLPSGMTPLDMDWGSLTIHEQREMALAIGVPSEMIGDTEVKTFANYQDARASFYTETVLPLMDIVRDEWNNTIVPMYGPQYWLDYNTEDIEALAPMRAARWAQINTANFLTINEKREATGYGKIPNGDVIVLLTTNATLDEVAHGTADGAQNGVGSGTRLLPAGDSKPPSNDTGGDDGGAPPTTGGTPDGGMGSAVDVGEKAYDPLDDILAGRQVRLRPKAAAPRRPSRFQRRMQPANRSSLSNTRPSSLN